MPATNPTIEDVIQLVRTRRADKLTPLQLQQTIVCFDVLLDKLLRRVDVATQMMILAEYNKEVALLGANDLDEAAEWFNTMTTASLKDQSGV